MRVAAVLVVRDDDVGPVLAQDADERHSRDLEGRSRETVRMHRLAVLREARVEVAEPAVLDAHDLARASHLDTTQPAHVAIGHGARDELRVLDVSALASRAADDHHVRADAAVVRVGRGALARLVVGVGVDRKQPKCHRTPSPIK
jgi:hypothetical protein